MLLKMKTMEETQPLRFARLLQMVRSMEADMGINALNKAEKMLFTCVGDLCLGADSPVNLTQIFAHPDVKKMPQVTVYKCLRDLRVKGLLEHVGGRGSGLYRLG
ncbi:hypothetical protein ABXT60_13660 [Candidatus Njordibacter sp. Uisw_056]|uniref:hypothetical protein n=1 Tax=Candidatus Njordibacter sp. Uisw_056 TaxID=3230973 RepID=UPI003D371667